MAKRIKTGIFNLDPLLKGGVKQNSTTLVVGRVGSGKTTFAIQFLMEGLKEGESCLYITFEEKKDKLYDDVIALGFDLDNYEKQKKFFYQEYSPEQVKSLIEEGGGTIEQIITKNKITRLAIDPITSFSLLYKDELSRKQAGLALFDLINTWGCTAVVTATAISEPGEPQGVLEAEAEGIILLYHFKTQGRRKRAIEILKMRGTKHPNETMKLDFSDHGLIVKPDEVVTVSD